MPIDRSAARVRTRRYSDLDLDFIPHPVTKDVSVKINEESVKRSVRNLILTNKFERPFHPEIGGNVRALLFENVDIFTATALEGQIRNQLEIYEPRVETLNVRVFANLDANGFRVVLEFLIKNLPEPVTLDLFLEKLR
jgi:phage baseplate assembly protein W|tara:strand:- start:17046 stop:17459 length:414 start_codon:yes stop_codon:yes gene_type:complete